MPARSSRASPSAPGAVRCSRRGRPPGQARRKGAEARRQLRDVGEDGLLAVLCSKSFLYLEEGNGRPRRRPRLTDWELASRLSYFLWSTMPDERLLDLARAGKLHETETLRAEVRRMLADPKAAAFAESFPRQWLQLRNVGMFAAGQGALSRLRRVPRKEHDRGDDRLLPRSARRATPACASSSIPTGRCSTSASPSITASPGVKGEAMQRVALKPERSSRRLAHAGGDPQPHLRRHAASPGASRRVGAGIDLRQAAAAAARERPRAQHARRRTRPRPPCARSSKLHRSDAELRRLPSQDRPARPRLRQLRRHRPLAHRGDRARRHRRRTRSSIPAANCPMAASSPTPTT